MQSARTARDPLFDEAFLRKLEGLDIAARRLKAGVLRGERRSVKRGQSVEFADYRDYTPGDDLRRVDWHAYARFERAFLKLYHEEEDRTVHILVDDSPSMDWGDGDRHKLTYARRAAAALGYIALAGLDRLAVGTVGAALGRRSPAYRGGPRSSGSSPSWRPTRPATRRAAPTSTARWPSTPPAPASRGRSS